MYIITVDFEELWKTAEKPNESFNSQIIIYLEEVSSGMLHGSVHSTELFNMLVKCLLENILIKLLLILG